MIEIVAMHGAMEAPSSSKFSDRNMTDRQAFDNHLANASVRYVSLEEALAGKGMALTIDDATYAAASAALLAREYGHEVTLFINPFNVAQGIPYFFALLNPLLDRLKVERTLLGNRDAISGEALRNRIKHKLLRIRTERGRLVKLYQIARRFGVYDLEAPAHLRTVDILMIEKLVEAGVQIGNHSWTHADISVLSRERVHHEIQMAHEWIEDRFCHNLYVFAVPFGDRLPPFGLKKLTWLLNTSSLNAGLVGKNLVNRITLKLP